MLKFCANLLIFRVLKKQTLVKPNYLPGQKPEPDCSRHLRSRSCIPSNFELSLLK